MILAIGMIPVAHAQEVLVNGDAESTPVVIALGPWVPAGTNLGDNTAAGGGAWYLPSVNDYYPTGAMHGGFFFSVGDQLIAGNAAQLIQSSPDISALTSTDGSFTFTAYMATHGNSGINSDIAAIHIKYQNAIHDVISSWDTTFQPTAANDSLWHAVSHSQNFLGTDGIHYVEISLEGVNDDFAIEPVHVFFDFVSMTAGPLLPINLLDFRARQTPENTVALDWETSQEQNSSYTEIQRGYTGKDFVTIGRVKAAGNSNLTKSYSFVDDAPLPGNAFYRLRFVDLDGSFKFSKVLVMNSAIAAKAVQVLKNPFHDHLSVRVGSTGSDQLNLTLTDLQGRIYMRRVYSTQAGNNFIDLYPSGSMAGGIYLLNVRGAAVNQTIKVLKY